MLELVNLNKIYHDYNAFHALKDINLKFTSGELVAVLGESGSGKSTLLNVMSGLDRYDDGDILINGKSTRHYSKRDWAIYRNNYVGFIFQEYNLIDHLTLVENVELPLLLQGVSNREARERAIKKCELLGLKNHLNKIPAKLSGGQQQRAAIARSLVTDPVVLLADEPTGALDSENGEIILSILKKLSKDYIVILVTHDEDNARKYADRIVYLEDGRVIDDTRINITEAKPQPLDFELKKPKMKMRIRWKFSFNNIKKRKFRTFLTSLTMAIGLIAIFLIVFLINGIRTEVNDFIRGYIPDNQYYITSEKRLVRLNEEDLAFVRKQSMVDEAYFKYTLRPMYKSDNAFHYENYDLEGIPKKAEHFYIKSFIGRYPTNENEVIVTTEFVQTKWKHVVRFDLSNDSDLKNALDLLENESLTVERITYQQEPINESFKVVGIIKHHQPIAYVFNEKLESFVKEFTDEELEFDENDFYYNPIDVGREIQVFLKDDKDRTVERLEKILSEEGMVLNNPNGEVIRAVNNFFSTLLNILVGTASISLIVSGILIGLIIYISVLERVKEIGILTALGAKSGNIRSLFNFESGIIGFLSAFIALALSLLISLIINSLFQSIMRAVFGGLGLTYLVKIEIMKVDWFVVLIVFIISVIYSIISGLIPAFKASRLHAVEALRKE